MPRTTLSFGIEIECLVATLQPGQMHPDPTETRCAHFPKAPFSSDIEGTYFEDVAHQVRLTLLAAGLKVKPTPSYSSLLEAYVHSPGIPDFTLWDVTDDPSVFSPPIKGSYKFQNLEIRSPAYFFNTDALNETTGLHVHVGNGLESFSFDTVRRLIAFLYAFEPQISSLHPQHRFNTGWASSLRYGSKYSEDFLTQHNRRPRPFEGVAHFLNIRDWRELQLSCQASGYKRLSYRFGDLPMFAEGNRSPDLRLTVEFRQHRGTLDGEEIINWVRTVVGIVGFIIDSDIRALLDLFSMLHFETPDAKDGETVEPVLAETEFTIIDLLQYMDLFIPAMYYQKLGFYKIRRWPEDDRDMFRSFAGQTGAADSLGAASDSETQRRLREEMEAQQRAFHQPVQRGFPYDPYDPYDNENIGTPPSVGDHPRIQWLSDPTTLPRQTRPGTGLEGAEQAVAQSDPGNHRQSWRSREEASAPASRPRSNFLSDEFSDITATLSEDNDVTRRNAEGNNSEVERNEGDSSEAPPLSAFFGAPGLNERPLQEFVDENEE